MTRRPIPARDVLADRRGVTAIEFGILTPVLFLLLMGAFDLAQGLYLKAVLQGVVQKAARDSTLEGATQTALDAVDDRVRAQARTIAGQAATVDITRKSYRTFSDASAKRPEQWTDTNGDGRCDAGEPYVDANSNGQWDSDGGNSAQGGARDKTVYRVVVTYRRLFPIYSYIALSPTASMTAETVLQNQPFADQAAAGTTVLSCA